MDWSKLTAEIQLDPLGRDYLNMTAQDVANSLNTKDRSTYVVIPSNELLAWSAGGADDVNGVSARITRIRKAAKKEAPFNSIPESIAGIAAAAELLISRDGTGLNLSRPDHMTMLNALVLAGVLTESEKTEILGLATVQVSRAEELKLGGEPSEEDILRVREWI